MRDIRVNSIPAGEMSQLSEVLVLDEIEIEMQIEIQIEIQICRIQFKHCLRIVQDHCIGFVAPSKSKKRLFRFCSE